MANRMYDKGREAFATAQINWPGDAIRAVLVDLADYTPDFAADTFLSAIPAGARVATSPPFTGKTAAAGVLDADDLTAAKAFQSVGGDIAEALVIFKDTGDPATSRLLLYVDTATGLPVTPDGNNVTVTWDNGANRIAKL